MWWPQVSPPWACFVGNICSGLSYQFLLQALRTHPLEAMPPSQARVCLYSALIISQGLLTQGICLHMTDSRKRKTGEKNQVEFRNKAVSDRDKPKRREITSYDRRLSHCPELSNPKQNPWPPLWELKIWIAKEMAFKPIQFHVFLLFLPVCVCLHSCVPMFAL